MVIFREAEGSKGLGGERMSFQDFHLRFSVLAELLWEAGEHAHERATEAMAWGIRVIVCKGGDWRVSQCCELVCNDWLRLVRGVEWWW